MFNISSLTALVTLARSAVSVGEQYGTAAPALATGAQSIVTSGKAVWTDLGKIESDLKAGHYADEPADIQRAITDVGTAIGAVQEEATQIAALTTSSPSLPSLSGIAAVLGKL